MGFIYRSGQQKYWGMFMVGDFNYPEIHWTNASGFTSSVTSEEQCFADCIMDLYLFQLVEKPTRHNNVLDLVLTNLPCFVTFIDTGPVLVEAGLPSDHFPVVYEANASLKLKDSPKRLCYDLKNADFTSLNNEMRYLTTISNQFIKIIQIVCSRSLILQSLVTLAS